MHRKCILVLLGIFFCFCNVSCVHSIARYDGPYEGRVIDAETKQPIEGVVVLGVWNKIASVGAGGAFRKYHDAQETVTNKNGEFSIKGQGLKIMSSVEPMNVLIFKAGYMYESGPWESLKEGLIYRDTIKWEGKKPIIPLRKLTMEERKKIGSPSAPPDEAPFEKVRLILKEIDKDDIERGLPPRRIWKGHRIDGGVGDEE